MKISYLLNSDNIEDIHFIENDTAKKFCSLLDIDLDIYYDKYSNMKSTYRICDKYGYNYDYVEKFFGHCLFYNKENPSKTIIMKTDTKGYLYSPVFFHEVGHALEGYLFHNSEEESQKFTKIKRDLFASFLQKKDILTQTVESTEYIANILGLLLVAKIDHLSKDTNYLYSYYSYYKSINTEDTTLSDMIFISFFMNDNFIDMIKKVTPLLSHFDFEYIEFLETAFGGVFEKLKLDFSIYHDFFNQKTDKFKTNQATRIEDAIIDSFRVV